MTNRELALRRLGEGDLFHAEHEAGPTRICVVISVTETAIVARSNTVQEIIEFDRSTGVATPPFDFVITSVAALPRDIHDIFLGLDRKYREGKIRRAKEPGWARPAAERALTEDQSRAFEFAHCFYKEPPSAARIGRHQKIDFIVINCLISRNRTKMTDRHAALQAIEAGHLFYAVDAAGPVRICLAMSVSEEIILARSVTTQEIIEFDRRTGRAVHKRHGFNFDYVIASVEPLPRDIHEIMLSLDRNGRAFEEKLAADPEYESPPDKPILNGDQRRGLLFIADFYRTHPLPAG